MVVSGGGSPPPDPPSGLTYSENPATYTEGEEITPNTPSVTGTVTSYSVSPALPDGLTLDTTLGPITGTPTTPTAAGVYTVTASNAGGSTDCEITIEVEAAAVVNPIDAWVDARSDVLAHFSPRDPAATGSAPSSGSTLASYVDRKNAHTLSQAVSGRRPTYRADGSGAGMGTGSNRACLQFDGSDDCIGGAASLAAALSGTNAHTLIYVASAAVVTGSAPVVGIADGGTHRSGFGRNGSLDVAWHSGTFTNGSAGASWSANVPVVGIVTFNGTHISAWHNGTLTINNVAATITAATSFWIGALRDAFTIWNGKIADVIALSGAIDFTEVAAINSIFTSYYA